jgi:hypothetical protein
MITRETVLAALKNVLQMILSFQRSGTPSLEQTSPPRWQNPAARRMKLSGEFADKREGQYGGLALNAAPRRRSKTSWRVGN